MGFYSFFYTDTGIIFWRILSMSSQLWMFSRFVFWLSWFQHVNSLFTVLKKNWDTYYLTVVVTRNVSTGSLLNLQACTSLYHNLREMDKSVFVWTNMLRQLKTGYVFNKTVTVRRLSLFCITLERSSFRIYYQAYHGTKVYAR